MIYQKHYEVLVIGGGHAGVEAALAAARLGCTTLLLTINLDRIGYMPCNPAIGGPGKSQIVSEIDALGGQMGVTADLTYLQKKVLNRSRGPAVQSLRMQSDKLLYQQVMKKTCELQPNLEIKQDMVVEILTDNHRRVTGVRTALDISYMATSLVVTTGTFLNGLIHTGLVSQPAGRLGDPPSIELSASLQKIGLKLGRLKTGTTPRLDSQTINYDLLEIQPGDSCENRFSFYHDSPAREQRACYMAHTNQTTHDIILANLDRSPLYAGVIKGLGPRYCPSIEDKIVRFKDKVSHQLFVEPEGTDTTEIYLQGFNTSLPVDVQLAAIRSIKGLEMVEIMRPGYAVEYDFLYPYQLKYSLETKAVTGLFFAGQINGTSGYEEAAAQGLLAGINAALMVKGKPSLVLGREESYIGILIDDLINKDIVEPYRMMTARAEYRLLLRQDNADQRLSTKAFDIGLLAHDHHQMFIRKARQIEEMVAFFQDNYIFPTEKMNDYLSPLTSLVKKKLSLAEFMQRVEITWDIIAAIPGIEIPVDFKFRDNVEIEVKYAGYISRLLKQIEKARQNEMLLIPADLDYFLIKGLRKEASERLSRIRPDNLGQASRIAGVNPADISLLMIYLHKTISKV